MTKGTNEENYLAAMQSPRPHPDPNTVPVGAPPPYSSVFPSHSQEYGFHHGIVPSAPYPVAPVFDQTPHPQSLSTPQNYYDASIPVGTTINPTLYAPATRTIDTTPKIQEEGCCGNQASGWRCLKIALRSLIVLVVVAGVTYFVLYQIFDD